MVRQENMEQIKSYVQTQGGYILYLDSSCEGDSPKLTSVMDEMSEFVLQSAKLKSENETDLVEFLISLKAQFGPPHAVITDRGMLKAVNQVFPDCPHYICHFHFLSTTTAQDKHKMTILSIHVILEESCWTCN